jgi:Lrp/AsnC family leucine-responsive transcriptional regulator
MTRMFISRIRNSKKCETMLRIDEADKRILSLLAENSELSQSEIARFLMISQPAVAARLRKLKKRGIIMHQVGVNLRNTKLGFVRVDVSTNNSGEILKLFERCPLFLQGFVTSGKRNLCLFLVSEDLASLDACIDRHVRANQNVSDVEFSVVLSSARDFVSPLKMIREKTEFSPCGGRCERCSYYKSERCLGCPSTIHYKGVLFG